MTCCVSPKSQISMLYVLLSSTEDMNENDALFHNKMSCFETPLCFLEMFMTKNLKISGLFVELWRSLSLINSVKVKLLFMFLSGKADVHPCALCVIIKTSNWHARRGNALNTNSGPTVARKLMVNWWVVLLC